MSTAGKVLVVLIMLSALVWVILTAGVTELNRNGNKAVIDLTERVAKLQESLKNTQDEIAHVKEQTTLLQEEMDRSLAVINARQNDVQRTSSNIKDLLARVEYELSTVQDTVQRAEQSREHWSAEKAAEIKAIEQVTQEVDSLKEKDQELRKRLTGLRNEFKTTLKANVDLIQKAVK
jgi:chromosome segregation ATPase